MRVLREKERKERGRGCQDGLKTTEIEVGTHVRHEVRNVL